MAHLPLYIAGGIIGLIILLLLVLSSGPMIIFPILGIVTAFIFGFKHWALMLIAIIATIYSFSTSNPHVGEAKGFKTNELIYTNIISSAIIIGLFIASLLIK